MTASPDCAYLAAAFPNTFDPLACCGDGAVTCSGGHITEIHYIMRGMTGTLGPLTSLKSLNTVNLYGNAITGGIPDGFGSLPWTTLILGANQLTGTVPASLASLTSLQIFDLSDNQLTGSLPNFNSLTQLTQCQLSNNCFSGSVPSICAYSNSASCSGGSGGTIKSSVTTAMPQAQTTSTTTTVPPTQIASVTTNTNTGTQSPTIVTTTTTSTTTTAVTAVATTTTSDSTSTTTAPTSQISTSITTVNGSTVVAGTTVVSGSTLRFTSTVGGQLTLLGGGSSGNTPNALNPDIAGGGFGQGTTTPSLGTASSTNSKVSAGAIIGGVVAALLFCAMVTGGLVAWTVRRRRLKSAKVIEISVRSDSRLSIRGEHENFLVVSSTPPTPMAGSIPSIPSLVRHTAAIQSLERATSPATSTMGRPTSSGNGSSGDTISIPDPKDPSRALIIDMTSFMAAAWSTSAVCLWLAQQNLEPEIVSVLRSERVEGRDLPWLTTVNQVSSAFPELPQKACEELARLCQSLLNSSKCIQISEDQTFATNSESDPSNQPKLVQLQDPKDPTITISVDARRIPFFSWSPFAVSLWLVQQNVDPSVAAEFRERQISGEDLIWLSEPENVLSLLPSLPEKDRLQIVTLVQNLLGSKLEDLLQEPEPAQVHTTEEDHETRAPDYEFNGDDVPQDDLLPEYAPH